VILQTKVSLRCVRFLDQGRLLVGVRSRSNTAGVTTYIRAARAQLLLYAFDEKVIIDQKKVRRCLFVLKWFFGVQVCVWFVKIV
jgi:hypothetical protein